ncbi:Uncharacterised protein [Mycobacterium tuberculosis]|uniref:Uncharacterized protein n=1 Tax=Mycobacterium tuberculosis TaxID=1773 RepID=A0A655ATM2_MYCTX|nr:Uncharacterised protein [Mycobacterium tuberculosis]
MVSTTPGSRRRLAPSIGMIFRMRATIPIVRPVNMSARATNDPGNTEPMQKTSNQDTCPLTTRTPRRFRTGLPDTVIRTPKRRSTNRQ